MTSDQFVAWLEGKLAEHGAGKVVPDCRGAGAALPAGCSLARRWRPSCRPIIKKAEAKVAACRLPADLVAARPGQAGRGPVAVLGGGARGGYVTPPQASDLGPYALPRPAPRQERLEAWTPPRAGRARGWRAVAGSRRPPGPISAAPPPAAAPATPCGPRPAQLSAGCGRAAPSLCRPTHEFETLSLLAGAMIAGTALPQTGRANRFRASTGRVKS